MSFAFERATARTWVAIVAAFGSLWLPPSIVRGAQPSRLSLEAGAHLDEIINIFQAQWLHRDGFDWDQFRQKVHEQAGAAQTIPDTYDAIRLALTLLGDRHSYYLTASGDSITAPSPVADCRPSSPATLPPLPADVGYVRVRIDNVLTPGAIQDAVRKNDRPAAIGWIVDLRDSHDGSIWAALAGIGPLLGEGTAGFFADATHSSRWGYGGGDAWIDEGEPVTHLTTAHVDAPYHLATIDARVAVLTDAGVVSSGEAIAIAFRGRPNTRSFGMPTCGLSTAVDPIPLRTGGQLGVVTAVMADRTKHEYGGPVVPDEVIADSAAVVPRAIAWLRER